METELDVLTIQLSFADIQRVAVSSVTGLKSTPQPPSDEMSGQKKNFLISSKNIRKKI